MYIQNERRVTGTLQQAAHWRLGYYLTAGIASLQLSPALRILPPVCQVPRLIVSVAQYAIHVPADHVRSSSATGSMSLLDQTCSGARADDSLGSSQAEKVVQRASTCSLEGNENFISAVVEKRNPNKRCCWKGRGVKSPSPYRETGMRSWRCRVVDHK